MSTSVFNAVQPELVVANYFRLVQAIARKIKRRLPTNVDVEDLVQTGIIGLLEASSRYDVSRAVDFSAYASSRITGAILDELRKQDTCSRHDRKKAREAENAKARLRAITSDEPSHQEISEAIGMGLAEYDQMLQRLESSKLVQGYSGDDDSEPTDTISQIPSKDESPYDTYIKRENLRVLKGYMCQLKPKHRQVVRLRYFKEQGMRQIGDQLGVGEARVCQIHKEALAELQRLIGSKHMPTSSVSQIIQ